MWTAFGPTNVAIYRMTAAMELGDVQIAVDLTPRIDASALPTERRVRHAIETARAYTARNRREDALGVILEAEQLAPRADPPPRDQPTAGAQLDPQHARPAQYPSPRREPERPARRACDPVHVEHAALPPPVR
jgi:hypothetical protein